LVITNEITKIAHNNWSQALQDLLREETTMDNKWEGINKKTAINNSRTRAAEFKAQAKYTEANNEAGGNMKQLYDTTMKLSKKANQSELLNRSSPLNPSDIEAEHTDLPIAVTSPTIKEIKMAGHQTNQDRGTDVRHRSNCKHAPRSIQEDLERRTSTDKLHHTTISTRKCFQQSRIP
ncbi:hypothetical protein MS3_00010153, partial [Schistosoma haematobium]